MKDKDILHVMIGMSKKRKLLRKIPVQIEEYDDKHLVVDIGDKQPEKRGGNSNSNE